MCTQLTYRIAILTLTHIVFSHTHSLSLALSLSLLHAHIYFTHTHTHTGMQDNFVRSQNSSVASAWVYFGLSTLVKLATLVGRPDDATKLGEVAAGLKLEMNLLQVRSEIEKVYITIRFSDVFHTEV